jgi:hypothetical protein
MTNPYFNSILIIDQDIIIPVATPQDQEPPALEEQAHSVGPDLDLENAVCLEGGAQ